MNLQGKSNAIGALDIEPGDEIIVSSITDFGTVQGLINQNYIPVFADTEQVTLIIND